MELARICEGYIYSAWVVIRGRVYSKPASERIYLNRVLGVLYRGSLTAFTVLGIISSIYQLRFFVREQWYLHYSYVQLGLYVTMSRASMQTCFMHHFHKFAPTAPPHVNLAMGPAQSIVCCIKWLSICSNIVSTNDFTCIRPAH